MPSPKSVLNERHWPPSQPLFPYANDNQLRTKKTFRQFISFGLKNSSGLVSKINYIPLPDAAFLLVESKKIPTHSWHKFRW